MQRPKRVGVLTGGGDCPGLNAVVRAVTKGLLRHEVGVVGIEDGFLGLIEDRMRPLERPDVSDILTQGGTILGTSNRADPVRFHVGEDANGEPIYEDRVDSCMQHAERAGLDALVVIGGDGTMTCAQPFAQRGLPIIGIPKTIDNDIHGTDLTFGFQSAVAVATDALDRLHSTAASHHRVMLCEVMGRNAGWIALHAGIASGADVLLLPEIPFDIEHVCEVVKRRATRGRRFTIVCVAEGAAPVGGEKTVHRRVLGSPEPVRLGGVASRVADDIEERTGVSSRFVVLGHVQRGGTPVAADRVLATEYGARAVQHLLEGARDRLVALRAGRVEDVPISEPAGRQRLVPLDHPLVEAARSVYTSFGDRPTSAPQHAGAGDRR
ncbi:MAG: ATP-dependent 6-phosphofructokinase [Planctomycetota bacterium]